MKRWLIVAWDNYYPGGGLNNIVTDFDDETAARKFCALAKTTSYWDNIEVVDRDAFRPTGTDYGVAEVLALMEKS